MFKKLLLFLSYISVSSQFFMTSKCILPFQNNPNNSTIPQDYPILTPREITQKRINHNDALTMFKIWATLFVFTFPIISFPYHKEN